MGLKIPPFINPLYKLQLSEDFSQSIIPIEFINQN